MAGKWAEQREGDFQRQLKLLPSEENKTEARLQRAAFEKTIPTSGELAQEFFILLIC